MQKNNNFVFSMVLSIKVQIYMTMVFLMSFITFIVQMSTQVEDSGHRIPQDPAGKMRESHRILQENTGNRWNLEAVFRPETIQMNLHYVVKCFQIVELL